MTITRRVDLRLPTTTKELARYVEELNNMTDADYDQRVTFETRDYASYLAAYKEVPE